MTDEHGEPSREEVAAERQHLFNLAYRMFGSTADAEEVVQQTYARWYGLSDAERAAIASPREWLTATAGRTCLQALARGAPLREDYPGEWLPEPVPGAATRPTPPRADVGDRLTLDESVRMGLLVTLDSLTPAERVAFVLHDVFGMPFASVGAIVGRTAVATRTLARSARRRIQDSRIHDRRATRSTADQHGGVVHALRLAAETGEPEVLAAILDPDVTMLTDTGAEPVDPPMISGPSAVASVICDGLARDPLDIAEQPVNGQSGLVLRRGGRVIGVVSANVRDGLIVDLWVVANPEKLRHWNRQP